MLFILFLILYAGKLKFSGVAKKEDLDFAIARATDYFNNCIIRDAVCFYLQLLRLLLIVFIMLDGWSIKAFRSFTICERLPQESQLRVLCSNHRLQNRRRRVKCQAKSERANQCNLNR